MSTRLPLWFVGLMVALGLYAAQPVIGQEPQPVKPEQILENPQYYWALPIVFKDTLVAAPGRREVRINREIYTRFETRQIGEIYADNAVVPRLEILELDREYIFSGTVLQEQGFWRTQYYIVVRDVKPAILPADSGEIGLPDLQRAFALSTDVAATERLRELLEEIEQQLFAFAQKEGLQTPPLLASVDDPVHEEALEIIRSVIAQTEREEETTSRELLTQFLAAILSRVAAPAVTPVVEPAGELEPPPVAQPIAPDVLDEIPPEFEEMEAPPAPEETVEAPAPAPTYQLKATPYLTRIPVPEVEPAAEEEGQRFPEPASQEVEEEMPPAEELEPPPPSEPGLPAEEEPPPEEPELPTLPNNGNAPVGW